MGRYYYPNAKDSLEAKRQFEREHGYLIKHCFENTWGKGYVVFDTKADVNEWHKEHTGRPFYMDVYEPDSIFKEDDAYQEIRNNYGETINGAINRRNRTSTYLNLYLPSSTAFGNKIALYFSSESPKLTDSDLFHDPYFYGTFKISSLSDKEIEQQLVKLLYKYFYNSRFKERIEGTKNTLSQNNEHNGHKYVNLGLSVKWATCNIGASKPEEIGYYLCWGEKFYKTKYSWLNYCHRVSGNSWRDVKLNKYNTKWDRGIVDNRTVLDLEEDVAHLYWHGNWHIPSLNEIRELLNPNNCIWEWTKLNGVVGCKVTSKKIGYTGNSIFLPASGYQNENGLIFKDSSAHYWSNTINSEEPQYARSIYFDNNEHREVNDCRSFGLTIRPVCF